MAPTPGNPSPPRQGQDSSLCLIPKNIVLSFLFLPWQSGYFKVIACVKTRTHNLPSHIPLGPNHNTHLTFISTLGPDFRVMFE